MSPQGYLDQFNVTSLGTAGPFLPDVSKGIFCSFLSLFLAGIQYLFIRVEEND